MQVPGHVITWEEFRNAFRKAFLNEGVMDMKKAEFRALTQGSQSVSAFLYRFNRLMRYAKCDVPTEDDKQEKFRLKLTPQLRCGLATSTYSTFQDLVTAAIRLETSQAELREHLKRNS